MTLVVTSINSQGIIWSNPIVGNNLAQYNPLTLGQYVYSPPVGGTITVSGLGRSAAVNPKTGQTNRYATNGWSSTLDPAKYFYWRISSGNDGEIDFDTFAFSLVDNVADFIVELRSSYDGDNFQTPIYSWSNPPKDVRNAIGIENIVATNFDNTPNDPNDTIEFRLYCYGAGVSTNTIVSLGAFDIKGDTVNNVPLMSGPCQTFYVGITGDTILCPSESSILTANAPTGATFVWGTAETTQNITVSSAGTYTVTASNASSCTSTASIVVTQQASNPSSTISEVQSCVTGTWSSTMTAAAGVGNTYLWDNSTSTNTRVVSSDGTYTVTVTDVNGCSSSSTLTVTLSGAPVNVGGTGCYSTINGAIAVAAPGQQINVNSGVFSEAIQIIPGVTLNVNTGSATVTNASNQTICNDGTIVLQGGGTLLNNGTFRGKGTVSGGKFVNSASGLLSPGTTCIPPP